LRPRSVYRDPALVQRVLAKMAEACPLPGKWTSAQRTDDPMPDDRMSN